ncbi:MAG: hypothetical protein CL878_06670, partial [Dehalococcoidia bacterium]|nr:hypothetical protein [Dehalococcoidia bacterium]
VLPGLYHLHTDESGFVAVRRDDLLGGIMQLEGPCRAGSVHSALARAIPYCRWSNRGASPMRVWVDAVQ